MRKTLYLLLISFTLLHYGCRDEINKTEPSVVKQELDGKWGGMELTDSTRRWVFSFDKSTGSIMCGCEYGESYRGSVLLHSEVNPKSIDFTVVNSTVQSNVGKVFPGIYQLQNDTLTIALNTLGTEARPKAFLPDLYARVFTSVPVKPTGLPPLAPTPVSPRNNSPSTRVDPVFTWTAVPGADSYTFQLSETPQFTWFTRNVCGIAQPTIYFREWLSFKTIFYWRVRATNSDGDSEWSEVFNFKVRPDT